MKLERADRALRQALKRLAASDTRLKRRNARLALFGVLRQIKYAVNEEYPAIPKEKPERQVDDIYKELRPKPERRLTAKTLRLPFRRGYSYERGFLFAQLVCAWFERPLLIGSLGGDWRECIYRLACWALQETPASIHRVEARQFNTVVVGVVALYEQFWNGEIFVTDLELAARHQAFIEGRKK